VVLDPLGIPPGRFFRKPQRTQERDHQPVAPARHLGQIAAGFGQEDRPVGAVLDQAITLQAGYGRGYRRLRDPEVLGHLDEACLAVHVDQIRDQLDIILGDLGSVGRARLAKGFRPPPPIRRHRRLGRASVPGLRSPSARDAEGHGDL
jgi:hypothetical protein